MKSSTTIVALAGLVASALADSSFGVIAARSGSPIHLQGVHANGNEFWIGKPTSTYCPEGISGLSCPVGKNETVFAGGHESLGLDVEVPGGQQVYIAPDGSVKFTQPHSANTGENAILTGWSRQEYSSFGELSWTHGLVFCPQGADNGFPYKMFAAVEGVTFSDACLGADLLTTNTTGVGAWEYI